MGLGELNDLFGTSDLFAGDQIGKATATLDFTGTAVVDDTIVNVSGRITLNDGEVDADVKVIALSVPRFAGGMDGQMTDLRNGARV